MICLSVDKTPHPIWNGHFVGSVLIFERFLLFLRCFVVIKGSYVVFLTKVIVKVKKQTQIAHFKDYCLCWFQFY